MKTKYMIGVDLEGVAGVVGTPNHTLNDLPAEYAFACRQGVREANAATAALFDAGATEVTIWDNHGSGVNLDPDAIDPRCRLIKGSGAGRWPGLDESYAGVLYIGYHAMAGTAGGILAHSYSSMAYQWISVNGAQVGEMAIDAHMAGLFGVPLIFAASDEAGVHEAQRFFPWARTFATKVGYARNCGTSLSPEASAKGIREGVLEAVRALPTMRSFAFERPLQVQYRFMRMEGATDALKGARTSRVDDYTVQWDIDELTALFGGRKP